MVVILVSRYTPPAEAVCLLEEQFGGLITIHKRGDDLPLELTRILLLLSCYSTPSCVEDLIEDDLFEKYDSLNTEYAQLVHVELRQREPSPVVLIEGLDFCLLPKKLKDMMKCRIIYHVGELWPCQDLLEIIPTKIELISGLLESDELIFADYNLLDEFKAAVIKLLGLTSNHNRINSCRMSVIPYRSVDLQPSAWPEHTPHNQRMLLTIDTGLTSIYQLQLRLKACANSIKQNVIDEAQVIITKQQTFGTDIVQSIIHDPVTQDSKFKSVFALVQQLNMDLDCGAAPKIQLTFKKSEHDCFKACDNAFILLLGEPYVHSNRLLYYYLKRRAKYSPSSPPPPNHTPRLVISEHCRIAQMLELSFWPTFNPFSEADLIMKIKAAASLEGRPDLRTSRSIRHLESYKHQDWLRELWEHVVDMAAVPLTSPLPYMIDDPEDIVNRFLVEKKHDHKIIVCDVQGILGPAELTAANRLLLPSIVLQWTAEGAHALMDLYLTTQIGIKALQDAVGRIGFMVDADQGHLRKSIGSPEFRWISNSITQEESKSRLKHAGLELLKYYMDRTPGSFITKSETSLTFHVPDIQRMTSRMSLQELTTQLQTGVVTRDPDFEMDVQARSVRVSINSKQQRLSLLSGVEELRELRSHLAGFDLLCIGNASLLHIVRNLWPDTLTVGVQAEEAMSDSIAEYMLKDHGDVVKLLTLLRRTAGAPLFPVSTKSHTAHLLPVLPAVSLPDYTPSAIGVLDNEDTSPSDSPPFLTPLATPHI